MTTPVLLLTSNLNVFLYSFHLEKISINWVSCGIESGCLIGFSAPPFFTDVSGVSMA